MLVIFTVILLGLLVLGLPVAFSLGTAGLFGMFAFMGRLLWRNPNAFLYLRCRIGFPIDKLS